jgi:hypothetical protein
MERLFVSSIAGEVLFKNVENKIKDQTSSVDVCGKKNFSDGWLKFYAPG